MASDHEGTMKTLRIAVGVFLSSFVVSAAWSAVTALGDEPVITQNKVAFNILFTLDNSGSMYYTVPNDPKLSNYTKNCYRFWGYNGLYFNPSYQYLTPRLANGTRLGNQPFTAAKDNGFDSGSATRNLGTNFGVYPKDNNPDFDSSLPTGTGITLNSSTSNYKGAYYFLPKSTASAAVKDGTTCGANTDYDGFAVTTAAMQQNFANWYSYYRSRILTMKSAVGEAFYLAVKEDTRVGFHTINSPHRTDIYGGFLPVLPFTGTHKANWYKRFYEQMPSGSTPLRAAEQRAGEYFQKAASPAGGSVADPVQYYCQRNYHMLSTDGYWNTGSATGAPAANNDDRIPDLPALVEVLNEELAALNKERLKAGMTVLPAVKAGDPWIPPYREKAGSNSSNTLSDVATYFWATDLRTDMRNEMPVTSRNKATWQHMVTYGVSLGARGSIPVAPYVDREIALGSEEWPVPVQDTATAIDDLWHASINSRGLFANVNTPDELITKVNEMLQDAAQTGVLANIGLTNPELEKSGVETTFKVSHHPVDWTGNLEGFSIDPLTGVTSTVPAWEAKSQLDNLVAGTGFSTKRIVATWNTQRKIGVPFRLAELSTTQKTTLSTDSTKQALVLNYLRGDRSNEGMDVGEYRVRASVLGDIVNSEPAVIGGPSGPYDNAFNPGYSQFAEKYKDRPLTVYVGANDGMLHAFNGAATEAAGGGKERWAYVPGMLYRSGADGLAALTYRTIDPLPNKYAHRFYVDQAPTVRDVDLANTGTPTATSDWRTLLVSGLNKGGKGYFALDVTVPEVASESELAGKVLWEFTGEVANDPKLGYSYGRPLIVKTKRFGWVVFVTSGIGNQDANGRAYIWALSPKTGAVLHRFQTPDGFGSVTNPLDMAHVTALIPVDKDWTATQLYAGDMRGNLWRFDVSDPSSWSATGQRIANFGDRQPITTLPSVEYETGNLQRWVFVGTGRLLHLSDLTNMDRQTFYAIKDGTRDTPDATLNVTKADLQNVPANGTYTEFSKKGWYIDLVKGEGERIIMPFKTTTGVALVSTYIPPPNNDPCIWGLGDAYVRSWSTAEDLLATPSSGSMRFGDGIAGVRFLLVGKGGSQSVKVIITTFRGETIELKTKIPGQRPSGSRVIWRLIQED
jgi:type IV pilus assembly protein PilY1